MPRKNNVNIDALQDTVQTLQKDPSKAKRVNRVEGMWQFQDGLPQFSSEISFEGGKLVLDADQPTFQGGGSIRPGPMHYALFGLASCFTATFVTMAALEGLELEEVKTAAEFDMNLSKVFGVADLPIIEEVRVTMEVRSPASRERIKAVARLAEQRCPAVFCLTNPIRLSATVMVPEAATP